jgi:hypothetical protein
MLSIYDPRRGLGRREFLRIGSLALGGLSLPSLLAAQAKAAPRRIATDKSVILLFMHGGPSQIETFDPKMTAPVEVRSVTGEVPTSLPGITFGGTYPKLAALAQKLSIVRSYKSGDANHDIKPVVAAATMRANLGSLYSRIVGPTNPQTGMPTNAALFPKAVDPDAQAANENFGKFGATGSLGVAYAPFVPGGGGELQKNMTLELPRDRLDDRRGLLSRLDTIKRAIDTTGTLEGMDYFQQQAFQTILGGVADAFDLSKEDPRTLARYDTAAQVRPDQIDRKLNNYKNYVDHGRSLGKLLLLARRLCEAGCGFVTVTTNFVWDNHADVNNAGVEEGQRYCGFPFDHAVSAFIEDLHARGLSDKILLVATGEMGRTPRLNKKGGRDHWGNLTPLLLSGGGLQMGKVIGQSTRDAGEPLTEAFGISHLVSTVMNTLFDIGELRILRSLPRDLARTITEGEPISGLL